MRRETSPAPVAEPPSSTSVLSRAEQGWLRSIVGKKSTVPKKLARPDATNFPWTAMANDEGVTGNVDKCIAAHCPRKQMPKSKARCG
eukprot:8410183-Pyramimonas_sp.AAC.1